MNDYEKFIAKSRYARWMEGEQRREDWEETVGRYISVWDDILTSEESDKLNGAIVDRNVMPSMRALMTGGKALDRDHVAGYNCAYIAIDHVRAFDELMYILMCGTGVGFSVERQYINRLPEVAENLYESETTIAVRDSKIGWAKAFKELLSLLYNGDIPKWDLSKVRASGERLKTFGGRASGPAPLHELFVFTVELFKRAEGRKLNSLECHDLCCKVAEVVVVGGVRRSALISLSNLTDERMRRAKTGAWGEEEPQRSYANNSVAYTEKPDVGIFMKEWINLHESGSGERGVFNRRAAQRIAGRNGRRDTEHEFGTNPCSEIILRSKQFCNLSEVVIRPEDTLCSLKHKVEQATILGTLQSTLTNFRYLRKEWKDNCEEERLLGVSFTGIMDHPVMSGKSDEFVWQSFDEDGNVSTLKEVLVKLREVAIETNRKWADRLGINASAAITCVKPSGTVSQLCNTSSGIHPRHSRWYVRRVRNDEKDPISQFLIDQGVPWEMDVRSPGTVVFSFPIGVDADVITKHSMSAIQQLELWAIYQEHWCEHKPSCSVYMSDNEVMEVGAWVWKHFDILSGISFFPKSKHVYAQAPEEEITEEEYKNRIDTFPSIEWSKLKGYESSDNTISSQELACSAAGGCEI